MITDQQLIDKITESFITKESKTKGKKVKPCRIKWMGKFVRLQSGKTVWRSIGDAKNALRNHFDSSRLYCVPRYFGDVHLQSLQIESILSLMKTGTPNHIERNKIYHEFIQVLQDKKILQFVEVDFESLATLGK